MTGRNAHSKSLAIGLAVWACVFATQASAELSAQERLDAIRQGLIDASLQTPTKVLTTTWIDSQGSLRESSSFKNGMEVRGVRVVAYDRDEAGQPKAKLQYPATVPEQPLQRPEPNLIKGALQKINKALNKATDFAKDLAPKPSMAVAEAPLCKVKVGEKLKHVMSLDLQVEPSANPVFHSSFLPLLQAQWVGHAKSNSGWRMVNALPAPTMSNSMTAYERALIGNRPDSLPWTAKLLVRTEQMEASGLAGLRGEKGSGMLVHMRLLVNGEEGQNVGYEDQTSFALEMDMPAWSAPKLNLNSVAVLQNEIDTMRSHAEEWLACQSVHPVVTAVAAKQLEINAGALAGVKKGDEWLVANPAKFPAELMSKDGAPQTLLAKVQSVTPFNSQLVVLAGPAQSAQANWRAWPTETLVKEPNVQPTVSHNAAGITTSKRATKSVASANANATVVMTPY
jgi:hypothetical protein